MECQDFLAASFRLQRVQHTQVPPGQAGRLTVPGLLVPILAAESLEQLMTGPLPQWLDESAASCLPAEEVHNGQELGDIGVMPELNEVHRSSLGGAARQSQKVVDLLDQHRERVDVFVIEPMKRIVALQVTH